MDFPEEIGKKSNIPKKTTFISIDERQLKRLNDEETFVQKKTTFFRTDQKIPPKYLFIRLVIWHSLWCTIKCVFSSLTLFYYSDMIAIVKNETPSYIFFRSHEHFCCAFVWVFRLSHVSNTKCIVFTATNQLTISFHFLRVFSSNFPQNFRLLVKMDP